MSDNSGCRGLDGFSSDLWPKDFDMELPILRVASNRPGYSSQLPHSSVDPARSDVPDFFFPSLDQLPADTATEITDLTNSLPKNEHNNSLSAQAILAKLECSDLGSSLNHSLNQSMPDDQNRGFDADIFGAVCDEQYDEHPVHDISKTFEPCDVYGRVTCYDGKIVLQLRMLNLNTNFPINVSECWLCRNKVQEGTHLYEHKHTFQGVFQVSDEYVHLIIPESDHEMERTDLASSFDASQSDDLVTSIASSVNDFSNFRGSVKPDANFVLPYMSQAFNIKNKTTDTKQQNISLTSASYNKTSNIYIPSSSGSAHNIHTAVDNIYNMCNNNSANNNKTHSCSNISTKLDKSYQTSEEPANSTFLEQSLHATQGDNNSERNTDNKTQPTKKVEIGAKKRKSKAQKKPSAIRMKGDELPSNLNYPSIENNNIRATYIDSLNTNEHSTESSAKVVPVVTNAAPEHTFAKDKSLSMHINTPFKDKTLYIRSQKNIDSNYNTVKQIITKTEDVTCKICKERFGRNLSGYKKHMTTEHDVAESSIYSCPICSKMFGYNKHLVQHVRLHLGIKAFKCDKCGTRYGREASLKRHLMTHSQKRPYACSICPKSFVRNEFLKAHMQAHNRTRHVCEKCGIVCSSKFNLTIHLKKHSKEKPFTCELCSKSFVRSDFLDTHMEVVHKKNKLKCGVCSKLFSRRDVLKRHMSSHNDTTYDCKFCLKTFTRKDRLLAHKRTHEINSELKCSKCPAAFHRREVLLKHEKLHETKEQCDICFKFTASKEKLLNHLNWHKKQAAATSEDGPSDGHTCETCGKTLTRRDLLRKHIRRVHGRTSVDDSAPTTAAALRGKQFICDICSKGFTRSCNLRSHVLKIHSSQQDAAEDDPDELDSLNSALTKSKHNPNFVDLSVWTSKHRNANSDVNHCMSFSSGSSSFNINNTSSNFLGPNHNLIDCLRENGPSRPHSASPPSHLASNLSLPQLSGPHPHSPINLSAEAITAAAYLLAYPSYLGPYQ